MKIPKIKSYVDNEEIFYLFPLSEGEECFFGKNKPIFCYGKGDVKKIVNYFLKTGNIAFYQDDFDSDQKNKLTKIMHDKGKYNLKLIIVKKIGRVRKRKKTVGLNIKEGSFFGKQSTF